MGDSTGFDSTSEAAGTVDFEAGVGDGAGDGAVSLSRPGSGEQPPRNPSHPVSSHARTGAGHDEVEGEKEDRPAILTVRSG